METLTGRQQKDACFIAKLHALVYCLWFTQIPAISAEGSVYVAVLTDSLLEVQVRVECYRVLLFVLGQVLLDLYFSNIVPIS